MYDQILTCKLYIIGPVKEKCKCKIAIIFLSISLNMYFGCSKEPSHCDGSFEYPQHMFWLRNKKNNFQLHSLIWGLHIWFFWLKKKVKYLLIYSFYMVAWLSHKQAIGV